MSNTLDHKCPKCNAVLKFNPKDQNWKCEYCRSSFNLDELTEYGKKVNKELAKESDKNISIDVYTCSNCGAQIVTDENTSATFCVYCKNTAIIKDKLQDEFNPNYVIPFKNTKEDAIQAFIKIGRGKPLMPREFNNSKNINEMSGVYIPFWLYSYDADGEIEADCKRVSTWTSGNFRYTKTDTYLATRGGTMSFDNIPVDGSKKFDNAIMNSIEPFNYEDLKEFNYSYLSGFFAEKYDVSKEEASDDANSRAKNTFISEMKRDIKGYNTVSPVKNSINLKEINSYYVLLPVWMLNIKYKDKIYTFAMNGQTGKLVGNIPIDKKKAVLVWILTFTLVLFISLMIVYLGGKL